MVVPPADKKPNVFELRTYMSSSEGKGLNKVKMFDSGEIPLMQQIGLDQHHAQAHRRLADLKGSCFRQHALHYFGERERSDRFFQ
jgi:hypothetical protein